MSLQRHPQRNLGSSLTLSMALVTGCFTQLACGQDGRRSLPPSLPPVDSRQPATNHSSTLSPFPQNPGNVASENPSRAMLAPPQSFTPAPLSTPKSPAAAPNAIPTTATNQQGAVEDPNWTNPLNSQQVLSSGVAQLDMCTVQLIQKIDLPANTSGPLSEVLIREGESVAQGQIIAKVDDEQARTDLSVAAAKLEASELKVSSDIAIQYAQAGSDAAQKVWQRERTLQKRGAGTEAEVDEAYLRAVQAQLQIDKARHDYAVDQKSVTVEKLEVLRAKELLRKHSLVAPWGGLVRRIYKHQGEWANAGDSVVEMIQMDRLWVEGSVNLAQINPYQVSNRPVSVTMRLADGEAVNFQGRIVFVDPDVTGREYKVRAEVTNRTFQNHWLLIPGMKVQMEIDLLPAGPVESLGQLPPQG